MDLQELKDKLELLYKEQNTVINSIIPIPKAEKIFKEAKKLTEKQTYQAMEALIHNLNTMQSRCIEANQEVIVLDEVVPVEGYNTQSRNKISRILAKYDMKAKSGDDTYCNTKLMKIKDIGLGARVLSFNVLNGEYQFREVIGYVNQGSKPTMEYALEDGSIIRCTSDHKVLDKEFIYSPIGELDEVLTMDGAKKIISHKAIGMKEVYDITVKNNHNFVLANGTIVKNCGAQVPFSSINYGTGTTAEQRLVIKSVLEATDKGLGNGETPIFPVQVFKLKDGINTHKEDPNYDLFELSCKVSAKRLFPKTTIGAAA